MKNKNKARTKYERETLFLFNDEEPHAIISTTSPIVAKKLLRRLGPSLEGISVGRWDWKIEKSWVRLPSKRRVRVISQDHAARLLAGRKHGTVENAAS